jgi:hypothetical protein
VKSEGPDQTTPQAPNCVHDIAAEPQISPLRCAPVEMTILFENAKSRFHDKLSILFETARSRFHDKLSILFENAKSRSQDELSSRPERSGVERSAVFFGFQTELQEQDLARSGVDRHVPAQAYGSDDFLKLGMMAELIKARIVHEREKLHIPLRTGTIQP